MSVLRKRRTAISTIAALVVGMLVFMWGRPAAERLHSWVAGDVLIGPTAGLEETQEELDREVQEIGRLIRERQDEESPAQTGRLAWPALGNFAITSDFGPRVHPILNVPKVHTGLDIGAPEGAPAVASLSGRVIVVQVFPAYGQIVVVDHGGRLASVYAHLSATDLKVGDQVQQGAIIGSIGSTGAVTGPHLHFELRRDGEPVNPTLLLGAK